MRRNGFTLIELMVVIAIIIILAAVIYPSLARVAGVEVRPAPEPANAVPAQAEVPALKCEGGFLQKRDGEVITKDGVAVRC